MKEELQYAGFWIRVFASIIDGIIVAAITFSMLHLVYGENMWNKSSLILGPADFLLNWIFPIVFVLLFWNYYLATPGKMLINAKIVDARTGKKPSLRQFIMRYIGYIPASTVFLLGIFWVAFDSRKQGWHDKIAGTVVVRKNQTVSKVQFKNK